MEVRPIRPEEHDEAGRVTRHAYDEFVDPADSGWGGYLEEIGNVAGRATRVPVLVAVTDGRVIGSASLETEEASLGDDPIEPGTANVRMLGVDPEARGRGAGRALLGACIAEARRRGKRAVTLHTTEDMHAALALYVSAGFVRDPGRDWRVDESFTLTAYRLDL
ncbi:MAG TPA: GNAT family N-acetyltransferase [Actinomycetota bacterium]|nr:GNAT family N-acetyltransferase [Actinomycetota bacterium]